MAKIVTRIVIIGLGAAGFGAAFSISRYHREAEVTIVDEKGYLGHPCGLPFFLGGKIKDIDELKHNIQLNRVHIIQDRAVDIDQENRIVKTKGGEEVRYDKLIITTGSKPFIPIDVPEKFVNNGVYTVSNIEDTEALYKATEALYKAASRGKRAIVVGASAIGLETAIALAERGLDVSVIEMLESTFPTAIDPGVSKVLEEYLKNKEITLMLGKKVEGIRGDTNLESVIIDGEKILADIVVMATGVVPNSDIAKNAGIKTSRFGIVVDKKMETSIKGIYAAGDCIESIPYLSKNPYPIRLATTAYRQGIIAGLNALGGNLDYNGALGTFVSVVGDMEVAATGFNSFFAKSNGYKVVIANEADYNNSTWFSGVKILTDNKGKIIGAQAIGERSAERINVISTAIKAGMSVKDLNDIKYVTEDKKTVTVGAYDEGNKEYIYGKKGYTKPSWFPGGKEIEVNLMADSSGKLLGAKIDGEEGTAWRANALSTAIKAGFTLQDLTEVELAYCPAISQHYDVLVMAAELGLRKIR